MRLCQLCKLSRIDAIVQQGLHSTVCGRKESRPADKRNTRPHGANPAVPSSAARFVSDPNLGSEATQPSIWSSSGPYWPCLLPCTVTVAIAVISPVRTSDECRIFPCLSLRDRGELVLHFVPAIGSTWGSNVGLRLTWHSGLRASSWRSRRTI